MRIGAGIRLHTSNRFLGVEQDRYRTIVDQLDFYMGLEDAGFNPYSQRTQASNKLFIKPVSAFGRRGLNIRRPGLVRPRTIRRDTDIASGGGRSSLGQ